MDGNSLAQGESDPMLPTPGFKRPRRMSRDLFDDLGQVGTCSRSDGSKDLDQLLHRMGGYSRDVSFKKGEETGAVYGKSNARKALDNLRNKQQQQP